MEFELIIYLSLHIDIPYCFILNMILCEMWRVIIFGCITVGLVLIDILLIYMIPIIKYI